MRKPSLWFYSVFHIIDRVIRTTPVSQWASLYIFCVSLLKPHCDELSSTPTKLPSIQAGRTLPVLLFRPSVHNVWRGCAHLLFLQSADVIKNTTCEDFEVFIDAYMKPSLRTSSSWCYISFECQLPKAKKGCILIYCIISFLFFIILQAIYVSRVAAK